MFPSSPPRGMAHSVRLESPAGGRVRGVSYSGQLAVRQISEERYSSQRNSFVKIIVAEKISASAVAQLQEPDWTVLTADQLDGKLEEQLETADALIVRSAVQADANLLEHAKKLRVIGR